MESGTPAVQRFQLEETPLGEAARAGHLEVVKFLVESSVDDLDSCNALGRTPLALAARKGHHEVVQFLVEAGAAKDRATEGHDAGKTPLALAAENGHLCTVQV